MSGSQTFIGFYDNESILREYSSGIVFCMFCKNVWRGRRLILCLKAAVKLLLTSVRALNLPCVQNTCSYKSL